MESFGYGAKRLNLTIIKEIMESDITKQFDAWKKERPNALVLDVQYTGEARTGSGLSILIIWTLYPPYDKTDGKDVPI